MKLEPLPSNEEGEGWAYGVLLCNGRRGWYPEAFATMYNSSSLWSESWDDQLTARMRRLQTSRGHDGKGLSTKMVSLSPHGMLGRIHPGSDVIQCEISNHFDSGAS